MVVYDPLDILVEFLRARLTDPRGRHTNNSDTFTATASQTDFTLTPTAGTNVQAIREVRVDSVVQKKWEDYLIDLELQKIIFNTALSGGETVDVDYKEGSTSWIFPDKPRVDLGAASFPRLSIFIVNMDSRRLGQEHPVVADIEYDVHVQLDAWAKENQTFTIDGKVYEGDALTRYLIQKGLDQFRQFVDDVFPQMYDFRVLTGPRDIPREEILQALHTLAEFSIKIINLGEEQ